MSYFSDKLKQLRISKGLSQADLAAQLNVAKSTISMYEVGKREPDFETTKAIAKTLNVPIGELIDSDYSDTAKILKLPNIIPLSKRKLPVLGDIACGKPIYANEEHELYVDMADGTNADFCLRAVGDSMIGAGICDGDIVFIRRQPMVDDGEIACVVIEDDATLKRVTYFRDKNIMILKADNPKYKDMVFTGAELNRIYILGKAVYVQSKIR